MLLRVNLLPMCAGESLRWAVLACPTLYQQMNVSKMHTRDLDQQILGKSGSTVQGKNVCVCVSAHLPPSPLFADC